MFAQVNGRLRVRAGQLQDLAAARPYHVGRGSEVYYQQSALNDNKKNLLHQKEYAELLSVWCLARLAGTLSISSDIDACLVPRIPHFDTCRVLQYFPNNRTFTKGQNKAHYHSLKFTMVFPHEPDEAYMAMCYPYTYTDCQRHMREICNCPEVPHMGCVLCVLHVSA